MLKVYADGDLRVAFGGQTWTFNPACLSAQPVEVDANLMTAENPTESGSKTYAGTRGLICNTPAPALPSACIHSSSPAFISTLPSPHACFHIQAAAVSFSATGGQGVHLLKCSSLWLVMILHVDSEMLWPHSRRLSSCRNFLAVS